MVPGPGWAACGGSWRRAGGGPDGGSWRRFRSGLAPVAAGGGGMSSSTCRAADRLGRQIGRPMVRLGRSIVRPRTWMGGCNLGAGVHNPRFAVWAEGSVSPVGIHTVPLSVPASRRSSFTAHSPLLRSVLAGSAPHVARPCWTSPELPAVPNTESARKRVRQTARRQALNSWRKRKVKTSVKSFLAAIQERNVAGAEEEFRKVVSVLDRVSSTSTMHRNTAARRKSRLARRLNELRAGAATN